MCQLAICKAKVGQKKECELQVLTSVDPFGYYSEGIQQKLDDAFVGSEPGLEASTPLATPSGEKASEPTTFKQEAAQEGTASTEALSQTGRVC